MAQDASDIEERPAAVLAPIEADADALVSVVRDCGVAAGAIGPDGVEAALLENPELMVLTEEAITPELILALQSWGADQPDWSALPLLVLLRDPGRPPSTLAPFLQASETSGVTLTVLPRPVMPEMLRAAVAAAQANRGRQRRIRDQLAELDLNRRHMELLAHEVQHRAKNSLSRLSSILRQTRRATEDAGEALERFEARMLAMARGQDLLLTRQWLGADIRSLLMLEAEVMLVGEATRLGCDGAQLELSPEAALAFHLLLHELTTNAVKYGALSNETGLVAVRWALEREEEEAVVVTWTESGGPPIATPPERKGFGSQLIELVAEGDLGGTLDLAYRPEGLLCTMRFPVANVLADRNPETAARSLGMLVRSSDKP